jgi:hypothetical protein
MLQPPPLAVVATVPAAGATGAATTVRPTVTFNVAVNPASVTASTVEVLGPDGNPIAQAAGSPALDAAGTTATISFASRLQLGTTYQIHVLGGAAGVKDLYGGLLADPFLLGTGFTTALPALRPSPPRTRPTARRASPGTHPTVTFDEAMDPSSITAENVRILGRGAIPVTQVPGSPTLDATGRIATIVPAAPLGYDETYQIQVLGPPGGAADLDGAPLDGVYQHAIDSARRTFRCLRRSSTHGRPTTPDG